MTNAIVAAVCKGVSNIIEAYEAEEEQEGEGATPDEEALTALLWKVTYPPLVRKRFNRTEEAKYGADWLWWFVAQDGRSSGLLVQAKKLKGKERQRKIGFGQDNNHGRQDQAFLRTADELKVPGAYLIYYGLPHQRRDLVAGAPDAAINREITVGMLDALIYADKLSGYESQDKIRKWGEALIGQTYGAVQAGNDWIAREAFYYSYPLTQLADNPDAHSWPALANIYPDYKAVWDNLATDPGPGRVAMAIANHLAQICRHQFSEITAEPIVDSSPVFTALPADYGHFRRPYLPYALQGYRNQPPNYVRQILDGDDIRDPLPASVKYVVVVTDEA